MWRDVVAAASNAHLGEAAKFRNRIWTGRHAISDRANVSGRSLQTEKFATSAEEISPAFAPKPKWAFGSREKLRTSLARAILK
jgi:hypothetical protein